ncbi:NADH-quinone oxidoreductase subunit NuoF [Bdellovibrionota bacterium]
MTEKILTKNFGDKELHTLKGYQGHGGYEGLKKAHNMEASQVIEEVKNSNLRGLGGAGFSAGVKWGFVPKKEGQPRYLCVNADEGEPGTFKDRHIMGNTPHTLIEGIGIACRAIEAETAYIYIRGEFRFLFPRLQAAIDEAEEAGYLGDNILGTGRKLKVYLHHGAGAYVCGEETALLNSIEGRKGFPRTKPPFPAVVGLFGKPTIINNVETISHLPGILVNGAEWFKKLGTPTQGGTRILSVSGHVKKPGNYEVPNGFSLKKVIFDLCGGVEDDAPLKAVIPGGASTSLLKPDEIDINIDFDSMAAAGTAAGSAAIIVLKENTCIVRAVENLLHFFADESCGQCTPCREGTTWLRKILHGIESGKGKESDIDLLERVSGIMGGATICALADGAIAPVQSAVKKFRSEFEQHIKEKKCPFPEWTWGE